VTVIAHENAKKNIEAGKADTVLPTETFSDEMVFRIGGKTFELKYLGEGHGDDLIATVVRPENVAFVVDAVSPKRLPFRNFPRTDIAGLINQIKVIESLIFKTLVPGHSVVGTKQDATDTRVYIEKLMAEVTTGLKAGKSIDDLVKSVTMDAYKGWGAYGQFRPLNIQGMAAWLKQAGKV
jgi:glyoxylase-like metal-dependent hydrolase (beta-lactamase superfamily II)